LTINSRLQAFGLFTGQVGYAWNDVLLYAKGGAAVVDNRFFHTITGTNILINSSDNTTWGAIVGAGLEVGFAPNWSVGWSTTTYSWSEKRSALPLRRLGRHDEQHSPRR
jgi:outer membrane immunogenic protein